MRTYTYEDNWRALMISDHVDAAVTHLNRYADGDSCRAEFECEIAALAKRARREGYEADMDAMRDSKPKPTETMKEWTSRTGRWYPGTDDFVDIEDILAAPMCPSDNESATTVAHCERIAEEREAYFAEMTKITHVDALSAKEGN